MHLEAHNQSKSILHLRIDSITSVTESASAKSAVCELWDFFFPPPHTHTQTYGISHYSLLKGGFIRLVSSDVCTMQCWSVNGEFF